MMKYTLMGLLALACQMAIAQESRERLTPNQQRTILAFNGPNERKPSPVALFRGNSQVNTRYAAEWLSEQYKSPLHAYTFRPGEEGYIGETEKNLSDIFDKAREARAVLFFDEADAIFGRLALSSEEQSKANMLLKLARSYPGAVLFHCHTQEAWYMLGKQGCGMVSLD